MDAKRTLNVLITGVSSGIGYALTEEFIKNGHVVFGLFKNKKHSLKLKKKFNSRFYPIITNIEYDKCIDDISETLNRHNCDKLDILINNAGTSGKNKYLMDLSFAHIKSLFNLNCIGAIRVTKSTMSRILKSKTPVVVNISSRFASISNIAKGKLDIDASYSYRLSKAALNMFSACLWHEYGGDKIKIISINPGHVKTKIGGKTAKISKETAAKAIFNMVVKYRTLPKCGFLRFDNAVIEW